MFGQVDHRVAQPRVTAHAPPTHPNAGLGTSFREVPFRLSWRSTAPRFDRRQRIVRRVGLKAVVPCAERIQPLLDRVGLWDQTGSLRPMFQVAEDPLDPCIEVPCVDLAADVNRSANSDAASEPSSELAAVIGHEEPRRRVRFIRRSLDNPRKVVRSGALPEDPQRHDLPREAVDDRGDLVLLPEHSERGDVEVPDLIRRTRVLDVIWSFCRSRNARLLSAGLRCIFFKHTPYRRAAHLDPCSQDVPCDRPRPELRLGEALSDLMDQPANAVVHAIPRWAPDQAIGSQLVIHRFLPVADSVGMHDEALTSLFQRPAPEPHELEDLRPLCRRVLRPLLRGLPEPLRAEDCHLSLQRRLLAVKRFALAHESYEGYA